MQKETFIYSYCVNPVGSQRDLPFGPEPKGPGPKRPEPKGPGPIFSNLLTRVGKFGASIRLGFDSSN